MKLLSIDVGIKNLAICLLEESHECNILLWDVLNLCGDAPTVTKCTTGTCAKPALYSSTAITSAYFCGIHAKKSQLIVPPIVFKSKNLKKLKLTQLQELMVAHKIPTPTPIIKRKTDALVAIEKYAAQHMLLFVEHETAPSANDMDLISLGIQMRNKLDQTLGEQLSSIDKIIIENQISPIANRMKTLQGMLAQYFIMRGNNNVQFVSSANKLKGYAANANAADANAAAADANANAANANADAMDEDTNTYANRKKLGITVTTKLLNDYKQTSFLNAFLKHKKKDDLADSFLQGVWYIKKHGMKIED